MAKGRLGNDPFKRGAAARPSEASSGTGPARKRDGETAPRAAKASSTPKAVGRPRSTSGARPIPTHGYPATAADKARPDHAPLPPEPGASPSRLPDTDPRTPEPSASPSRLPDAAPRPPVPAAPPSVLPDTAAPAPPNAVPPRLEPPTAARPLAYEIVRQTLSSERLALARLTARGVGRAAGAALGLGVSTKVDAYGRDAALRDDLAPLANYLLERYWRVEVQGSLLVPNEPCVFVANHGGALPLDGLVTAAALRRDRPELPETRWLVEDPIYYARFLGTLAARLGAVRANPENAERLLSEGRSVLVFPEGMRGLSKGYKGRYQLQRMGRGGFAKLALRTGRPLVPVAIVGSEETLPLLGRIPFGVLGLPYLPLSLPPLPARWKIRFSTPIEPPRTEGDALEDPEAVQGMVDRTRESIEGMLRALLDERRRASS